MDISDLLALAVWMIVILSYVLRLVARGFKKAEEEARRRAARGGAQRPLEPRGVRRLETSKDAQREGGMQPVSSAEYPEGRSDSWLEQGPDRMELDEGYDIEWPREGRHSMAKELAEERAREHELEKAMPYETGSMGMEGEYSGDSLEGMKESRMFDKDDLMLAWEMMSGLEDEAEAFERELVQDLQEDAVASWLLPDGRICPQRVLSGIVWGTILGPPACKKGRNVRRVS